MTKTALRKLLWLVVVVALAASAFSSCSPRKNNAATRKYQAFITRYNIHYNGDTHYRETLKEMEEGYEDDYSALLPIHPAAARANEKAPQPSGNFDRSIEKAQKAIQLRSIKKKPKKQAGRSSDPNYKAWMKREEYNPFLHNSWLMMGRSQYMNGDFLGAASTFFYISRHFSWLPTTVTEARLWEALSYLAMDWRFEAETILKRIKPDKDLVNNQLRGLYYAAQGDMLVKEQEWDKAAEALSQAVRYGSKAQKTRLNFLLGQVYARAGKKDLAYKAYQAAGGNASASYRTKFNARIKQSEVFSGEDISGEVKALRRMTRYDRNKQYLDQIYYAIGNLYLSRRDTAQAIENYELAVEKSTRSGIDKALAQLTLGGLYYDRHLYAKAQPCYSEAVPVIPDTYPGYAVIKRRSDILDELAVYSQNVELQDSLLRLSAMTPEEQMKVVEKIIEELKKKEKEEAEAAAREEFLAQRGQEGLQDQNNQVFTMNTGDDSWYFYNTATKNAGRTEFQRRWGNRKLEDDWRRRNKQTFSFNDFGSDQAAAEGEEVSQDEAPADSVAAPDAEALKKENDPHYPEYYLKQIPKTDMEKQTANDIIQEGLYNMGVILKDKMDDLPGAEYEFTRLLTRFPDNPYRLDAYYNLYLMFSRAGDMARAEHYRQLILRDFPESIQGEALADPRHLEKLMQMPEIEQDLYQKAYDAYMADNNVRVHEIYNEMRRDYPMSRIMPKFMFLEALSYVTENNPEKFAETLETLVGRYPDTDVSPLASSYLGLLRQGRELNSSGGNVRGIVWSTRLSNDSTAVAADTPAEFDFESDGPQDIVFIYSASNVNANSLLFDVARHTFNTYSVRDFDIEQMRFGSIGLLVVSGFMNQEEAARYRSNLEKDGRLRLPRGVVPLVISEHNFSLLLDEGRSLDEYFDAVGDTRLDQIHDAVMGDAPGVDPAELPEVPSDSSEATRTPEPEPATAPAPSTPKPETTDRPTVPAAPSASGTEPAPVTPSTVPSPAPAPQQAAPETPSSETPEEPEEYPYDIPVPMLPTKTPPVAPRVK